MGGNSSRSATFDLRRKTIGRWTNSFRLQHSKRIHLTLGLASSWWWQKTKEEEGQVVSPKILQSRRQRKDPSLETRMPRRGMWSRYLHGCSFRSSILRQMWVDLCLQPN